MFFKIKRKFFLFLTISASFSFAENKATLDLIYQKRIADFEFIKNVLNVHYAPIKWKHKYCGWDLQEAFTKLRLEMTPDLNLNSCQHLLKDFFLTLKDYHARIYFCRTEQAFLPFTVKKIEGRYFINYISNKNRLPKDFFKVGDEILSFDNLSIDDAVQEVKKELLGENTKSTDQSLAEIFLTHRFATMGARVPKGSIQITGLKSNQPHSIKTFQLKWLYAPEEIGDMPFQNRLVMNTFNSNRSASHFLATSHKLLSPLYLMMDSIQQLSADGESNPFLPNNRFSFLPSLSSQIIWQTESDDFFHAYLFQLNDHLKVGYLRINHFKKGLKESQELLELISLFEKQSDGLIIDQFNNFGGYLFFCYHFLSTLTPYPLMTPLHRVALTPAEIKEAQELLPLLDLIEDDYEAKKMLGESLFGYTVTLPLAKKIASYYRFLINEWEIGHTLTSPFPLLGIDEIEPHPDIHYTKPILYLINELDISAADFAPAILQDNQRATLLGMRTAGAGGSVLELSTPNLSGIKYFTYTQTLAQRPNLTPIENIGVEPDIYYEYSIKDIQLGFKEMKSFILKEASRLFGGN